jgi:hypothetical protein
MKRWGAELILGTIAAPFIIWFFSFVIASYRLEAKVESSESDIQEIKQDVKYIKNYLLEKK